MDTQPAARLPSTSSFHVTSTLREASVLPSKPGGFVTDGSRGSDATRRRLDNEVRFHLGLRGHLPSEPSYHHPERDRGHPPPSGRQRQLATRDEAVRSGPSGPSRPCSGVRVSARQSLLSPEPRNQDGLLPGISPVLAGPLL